MKTSVFGGNFSADVVVRLSQKILLTREKFSQFTITRLVKDEQAKSLKTALLTSILEFIPASGAVVQVGGAPGW